MTAGTGFRLGGGTGCTTLAFGRENLRGDGGGMRDGGNARDPEVVLFDGVEKALVLGKGTLTGVTGEAEGIADDA